MPTLLVNCRVPVEGAHEGSALYFRKWIPDGANDALEVEEGGFRVRVWIDRSCLHVRDRARTDDELARHLNIAVSSILVEVIVPDVPDDLAS